jgi:tetratricopeptide (TPR) repeat protein/DNA-binding XRE family transcriptional regulator
VEKKAAAKATRAIPNDLLRVAREQQGWTQQELADRIGISQSFTISRWETGVALPRPYYIRRLCDLFGISAAELGLLLPAHDETGVLDPFQMSSPDASPALIPERLLPLWHVPYRRNPFFTGRDEVLLYLHNQLTASSAVALNQTQAISGLGGIGKTQIAIEYAHRYRDDYDAVFWVTAATRETLHSDFVALARLLRLPVQDLSDQQLIVDAVKQWLARHEQWLLILDNADELALLTEFLPTGDSGYILLTTRAQATGSLAPSISIEQMSGEEGALLLLRRAQLLAPKALLEQATEADRAQAETLVLAMGGLPLALDQAGAYIEETGCGLPAYLELYRTHQTDLLQRRSTGPSDHPEPVAVTWRLAFLKVERTNPAAADLLRLCAFLAPDAIPEVIITEGSTQLGPLLGPVASDALALNAALEVLRMYSLVRRNPDTKTLVIHRLVQAVLKESMDEQMQRQWAERAVCAVNAAFPEGQFESWNRCQECLPHVLACAQAIEQYDILLADAALLLQRAGAHAQDRAQYKSAELLLQQSIPICRQVWGFESPQTVQSLNYLGETYFEQGMYEQAEPVLQQTLDIHQHLFGEKHPRTATSINNLAVLAYYQGKYEQAEPLYERALAIREQVLGFAHQDTAESLNNLASSYHHHGKNDQAETLYQRAVLIAEQLLGPEHPFTALVLHNQARLYTDQRKWAEAETLYQRALSIRERVLGPEHPRIAITQFFLACLYRDQGRYAEADALFQQALTIQEKMLGLLHPDTTATREELLDLREKMKQTEDGPGFWPVPG